MFRRFWRWLWSCKESRKLDAVDVSVKLPKGWKSVRKTYNPKTERFLWLHDNPGSDMIGTPVDYEGRKGRVIHGDHLTVLVEWD